MKTISLLSPGDMGSNIARFLIDGGYEIISPLDERSESTQQRANKIGIENCHTLENAVNNSQLLISILVPSEALGLSEELAKLESIIVNY
jgi:3-hydroxyisobutyrate dehydrogenase-like beta-hydroxyacid dehydrogenase